MARIPINVKKQRLLEFNSRPTGETQKAFCKRKGLYGPTFCKWLSKAEEILCTPDGRSNREVVSSRTLAKRALRKHLERVHKMGVEVNVSVVRRIADATCPLLLRGIRGYNTRYVVCKRLLKEMRLGTAFSSGRRGYTTNETL